MESKDLLHQEDDDNKLVTPETSTEAQNNTDQDQNRETPSTDVMNNLPEEEEVPAESGVAVVSEKSESPEATTSEPIVETEEKRAEMEETVSDILVEIENSQSEKEAEEEQEQEQEQHTEKIEEESIEKIEAEYENLDLKGAVETLAELVINANYNQIKQRVGILKAKILQQLRALKQEQLNLFMDEGGNKEDFVPEKSEFESSFNSSLQLFKENKAKYIEELEEEKRNNLEAKKQIIEGLRELVETESNLKILNDNFKQLQERWKEIGPVPQNESTNLWQNYHFHVEKFFDLLRLNKELRYLDLKKNMEMKIKLCETAESLLLMESIVDSFKRLQQLHDEWKEIGPVPEDKKEEIWERFKTASDQINTRRKEYYDSLYEEQQNNYNAKLVICEQAEELIAEEIQSIKKFNEVSEKLTALLKVWKTLGPAPAKLNDTIWNRFKETLDKFFQTKKDYFKDIKDVQTQNYNLKLNIVIRAEAMKDRTDWKQATEEMLILQREWKEIGSVPRKNSDTLWKRFRTACDLFFESKSNYFSNIKEIESANLAEKEAIIQQIEEHLFGDNKAENLETMKMYQRKWTETGHVPRKDKDQIYNRYREAVNKRFADLKVTVEEVRRDSYKNKIDGILNNPNAEKIIDKEKRFITNKLHQLKDDITLWENNLGFFAHSKNADILKAEFLKKIDAAKEEVKELEYKLRMTKKDNSKKEQKTEEPSQETTPPAEKPVEE